ncbi:MAG: hypothetical protein KAQ81_01500 [Deltaproteobacteria bacterium]|nr:hypothetical protein [Deltaproteobacteria bacterium]
MSKVFLIIHAFFAPPSLLLKAHSDWIPLYIHFPHHIIVVTKDHKKNKEKTKKGVTFSMITKITPFIHQNSKETMLTNL